MTTTSIASLQTGYRPARSESVRNEATGQGVQGHTAFATTLSTAEELPSRAHGGEEPRPNFSHMTSHELRKWINDQILSGKMTVAESSPYIGLTLNGMPLTGVGSPDDAWQNQPHDYLADLQAGISGARWRGNEQELRLLESVWARLTREQEATTRG